jgi:hypothetical protein
MSIIGKNAAILNLKILNRLTSKAFDVTILFTIFVVA